MPLIFLLLVTLCLSGLIRAGEVIMAPPVGAVPQSAVPQFAAPQSAVQQSAVQQSAVAGVALAGKRGVYTVRSGDNYTLIAARLGASLTQLKQDSLQTDYSKLRVGQTLIYENHHIVPPAPVAVGDAILINIPQRMLFHFRDGQLRGAYPAAAGRPDRKWQTPTGDTRILSREKDKAWVVPPSIQAEMRARGDRVLTRVPAGPANPLGRYWLGLALPGYGIHGTNAPASVYSTRTHGCIRLQPEHIEKLFSDVSTDVPVRIIYAPVLLYVPPNGPVWLEAHPDAYARGLDYSALIRVLANETGVTDRMDPVAAESVLLAREGLARDVARDVAAPPRN